MKYTDNYRMKMPERRSSPPDPADIEDLNFNTEITDAKLHGLEENKASREELAEHKLKPTLDHPNNSVTDDKIGSRTIGTLSGKLAALFSAIGDAIKGVKGTSNWNDASPTTLAASKAHIDDKSNPHSVTKAQAGLGNADNTSDANKPVSTAQATAIKVVQDDVVGHKANKSNPHSVTKAQAGLGSADNTSDANKPVSTAQAAAIKIVQDDVVGHKANKSNPHSVTKAQAGLGNADNTSDANKPVSTAQAAAIATKVDKVAGKQLSTEDYTTAEKNKLTGIAASANNYVHPATHPTSMITGLSPVVQTAGTSTTAIMSQKAVTDAITAKGGGDMLKRIYDTNENGAADKADKLTTVRTIALSGDMTGSVNFDGSANVTINAAMVNGMKVVDY